MAAGGVSSDLAYAINDSSVMGAIDKMSQVNFAVRSLFYLVTPNETSFGSLREVPDYNLNMVAYAPYIVFIEVFFVWLQGKRLPRWNDALTSMCCIILIYLPVVVVGRLEMQIYCWVNENFRVVELPWNKWYTWALCLLGVDFGSYLWHRAAHEINFIWAFHQVHHTPEDFNIFAGMRLPSLNRYVAMIFYLPCAFFFPPSAFATHYQLNYLFQFWIHFDCCPNLGFVDYFINNPSLHRVHHARNRYCIDKNYAAVFSFWDLIFGTLERERKDQKTYYGLVHPLKSWDTLYMQIHHLKYMWKKTFEYPKWTDKISVFVKGPGWHPGTPRLGYYEEIPEIPEDCSVYDKKVPLLGNIYLLWHLCLGFFMLQKIKITKVIYGTTAPYAPYLQALFVLWGVANIGYILEHKPFAPVSEAARCIVYFILENIIYETLALNSNALLILRATFAVSMLFWIANRNVFQSKETKKE